MLAAESTFAKSLCSLQDEGEIVQGCSDFSFKCRVTKSMDIGRTYPESPPPPRSHHHQVYHNQCQPPSPQPPRTHTNRQTQPSRTHRQTHATTTMTECQDDNQPGFEQRPAIDEVQDAAVVVAHDRNHTTLPAEINDTSRVRACPGKRVTRIHARKHTHTRAHTVSPFSRTHPHTHTPQRTHAHARTHTHTRTPIHAHTRAVHTRTHTHTHAHTRTHTHTHAHTRTD